MSTYVADEAFPEKVVIDHYILIDVCRLLGAVEEFARKGELEAVNELIGFSDSHLCADDLAEIAGEFASRVRRAIEASR